MLFYMNSKQRLANLLTQHGWPSLPEEMLPETVVVIADDQLVDIAGGCLYKTDSDIAILEFLCVNPQYDKIKRRAALDEVISRLCKTAKILGYTKIFTTAEHPGLISRYENHGFLVTDKNVQHLVRIL